MPILKTYFITGLLLSSVFLLYGQQKPIVNYTTHNGLPQIQVRAVYQDSRGYIWAGTKSGLVCFNGVQFTPFLQNESIEKIKEDDKGNLYIKTSRSLFRYNGNSMFKVYNDINNFDFTLTNKGVWVNCHYCLKQFQNDSLVQTISTDSCFTLKSISSFIFDKTTNTSYCIDGKYKNIYKLIDNKFQKIITAPNGISFATQQLSNGIICLMEINNSSILVKNISTGQEYYRCFLSNNKVDSIKVKYLPVSYCIYNDYYRYFKIDSATCSASLINLDMIKAPYPVILDKDMNFWAGSDNGLYQIMNSPFKIYDRSFMNDFWTIIKGKDGAYYGAAFKDGLYKIDFNTKTKQEIVVQRHKNKKETDYYYGASQDKKGNLYFPTHFGTVKYNYIKPKMFNTGISLISKYDPISERIIIGQKNGIAFISGNENIEYHIDSTSEIIVSHPVSIEFAENNTIWIGTGKSIAQYNRKTKKFSPLFSQKNTGPQNGVIAMTKDHQNNIWLGGKDGLWLYRTKTKKVERVDAGLIENNIAALISPNPDILIIGTSREIIALNLKKYYTLGELEMKLYNYHNGFTAEEVCQNGFLLDNDNLIIPSTTNTSLFNIKQIKFETEFNDVRINKINGQGTNFNINDNTIFQIEKGTNKVEFNFETLGFGLPTTPRFKYKLEGVDKDWKEWTTNTFASYGDLSTGKYTFRVISRTGSSISNLTPKSDSITIKISLPFYKEPDLYKYAFFIFLLLASTIIYFGWSRFRYKMKVSEREQKIRYLEIATLQAQLNPHFVFNFLSSVQGLISTNKPEVANSYLVKFSRLMRAYMESSIKSSKVLSGLSASNEITIAEEIELLKMYIDLEAMKHEPGKINYEIVVSNNQLLHKTIPPMIIQPLVENAIKHGIIPKSEPGHLKISFSEESDCIDCCIVDDGIGIKQSKELQNNSIKLYKSRGIELINKKIEILNELGYHINFKYLEANEGTRVNIHFNS